jgi:L-rhamnose mutarotase
VGEEAEELHLLAVRHFHTFVDTAAECVLETTKIEEEDEVYAKIALHTCSTSWTKLVFAISRISNFTKIT